MNLGKLQEVVRDREAQHAAVMGSQTVRHDWATEQKQVVQWLRLHAPNAESPGSIPGQGTRSHILQLRVHMLQLKISSAATEICYMPQ